MPDTPQARRSGVIRVLPLVSAMVFSITCIAALALATGLPSVDAAVIYLVVWTIFRDAMGIRDYARKFDNG